MMLASKKWAAAASSNPAWLFRYVARGIRVGGRLLGLAACGLRLAACDLALARQINVAELLAIIARCGRATPSWAGGKLGVVWADKDDPTTALITPDNIIQDSLRIVWAAGQMPDEVAVRYIDRADDYNERTLRYRVPGGANPPAQTATTTIEGITRRAQAIQEARLLVARQLHHRRRITWEMGAEGYAIARGDVVAFTHGLLGGGATGRVKGLEGALVDLGAVQAARYDSHLMLRMPDGTFHSTKLARVTTFLPADGDPQGVIKRLHLRNPPPALAAGAEVSDILWRLYRADEPPVRLRITGLEPIDAERIRMEAIDEVADYYEGAGTLIA